MRSRLVLLSALASIGLLGAMGVAGATLGSEATHGGRPFHATLLGANELGGGDPTGTGDSVVTLNSGQGEACWDITVENLTAPVILAHIHVGGADVAGGVVVDFDFPNNGLSGCTEADPALIKDIRSNPDGYYVNVHTTAFPGGAVRGQLGS